MSNPLFFCYFYAISGIDIYKKVVVRLKKFLTAAGILTLISFALKGLGMLFRVYLSRRMGSAGVGLYQLIMSVYSVFATFATSGFAVAVSRLAAERLGDSDRERGKSGALRVLCVASVLALSLGLCGGAVMFFGARPLSALAVGDVRTAQALRLLAFSMPFMSLSACLKGYFMAVGQIYKPSLASLFEQLAKIGITVYIFDAVYSGVTEPAALCTALVCGLCAGEALSYAFLFFLYVFCSRRPKTAVALEESPLSSAKRLCAVTLPIAASGYVSTLLHSVEGVLLPAQFMRYGGDREKALSELGIIRGMTIPLLFFPYAFLGALLSIKIPEVSRLNTLEDKGERNRLVGRIMRVSAVLSLAVGALFFLFPAQISGLFYGNGDCVRSTRILALVTPFMYMETVSDGLLKAMDEQKRSLAYGVWNSVLRLAAVLTVIPLTGAEGYLWLLVASNSFSFFLCFGRLRRITGIRLFGGEPC